MSDIPMPGVGEGAQAAARDLARTWWVFLLIGIFWIIFGLFVLSYNVGSLVALAVFAGVTFLITGLDQIFTAFRVDSWRWLWLLGGILSLIAGIITLAWPGRTLLVLSVLLAWFLVFKGTIDAISALANMHQPWWWVGLVLGVLEFILGVWAAGYPGRSLFVFVNLIGIYALFHGFSEIFAAFAVRHVRDSLSQGGPPSGGGARPAVA